MKIPDELKEMLKGLELQLRIYYSALNMATELLEKHEPHTVQHFETILETVDETIRDIHNKINAKSTRK
ncbi:MAG: hypothetical protein FWD31_03620 [Planctomycetaceae bacterium]|nr:hypothetical protein [Planctomycetaceae bacterium]